MADQTPAKINEAQKLLDLVKKSRPASPPGPLGTPKSPPGKPSPTR